MIGQVTGIHIDETMIRDGAYDLRLVKPLARLGYRDYFPTAVGRELNDDHVPLIQAGLPTANLIDFTYGGPANPYWHTPQDVPENVSAATLEMVVIHCTELPDLAGRIP